jgi:TonB family protein
MPWAKRVINRIKTNWAIPPAGRISTKGLVGISIIVTRDGKISSAKLSKSSQDESLDKAALAAFTRSNPLPGLPEDFPYHDLRAYFLFNYDDPEITPMADERRER